MAEPRASPQVCGAGRAPMTDNSPCPVCLGRIPGPLLSSHMAAHSKDDIVAALLQQQRAADPRPAPPQPDNTGIHFLADVATYPHGHQAISRLLPRPVNNPAPSTAPVMPSIFMPQMMVMSSPCLIPQPNGPPLLINMPSYIYPNMMLNAASNGSPSATPHPHPMLMSNQPTLTPPTSVSIPIPPSQESNDGNNTKERVSEPMVKPDESHNELGSRDMSLEEDSLDSVVSIPQASSTPVQHQNNLGHHQRSPVKQEIIGQSAQVSGDSLNQDGNNSQGNLLNQQQKILNIVHINTVDKYLEVLHSNDCFQKFSIMQFFYVLIEEPPNSTGVCINVLYF